MKALTATSVRFNYRKANSLEGPFDLIDGFHFENCEIFPYQCDMNSMMDLDNNLRKL